MPLLGRHHCRNVLPRRLVIVLTGQPAGPDRIYVNFEDRCLDGLYSQGRYTAFVV